MRSWVGVVLCVLGVAGAGLWLSRRMGLLDKPGLDIAHTRQPVPTLQGVFLYVSLVVSVWLFFPALLDDQYVGIFLWGAGALCVLAAVDELLVLYRSRDLPHLVDVLPSRVRLAGQLLVVVVVIWTSDLYVGEVVWGGGVWQVPVWLGMAVAVVWFVGFINAINWFDGAYGQATGLSAIGFLTLFLLVQLVVLPHYSDITASHAAVLSVVSWGSLLLCVVSVVFAVVEFRPWGLLRDAGIWVLGFGLAYFSLLGGAKIGTIMVALSLPIFDAVWVFCHRLFVLRKNPMKGDYTHLHHRLLNLGWTKGEVRCGVWLWSLCMMVLMLLQGSDRGNKVVIFVMMALLFFGVNAYVFWYKKRQVAYVPGDKGNVQGVMHD